MFDSSYEFLKFTGICNDFFFWTNQRHRQKVYLPSFSSDKFLNDIFFYAGVDIIMIHFEILMFVRLIEFDDY